MTEAVADGLSGRDLQAARGWRGASLSLAGLLVLILILYRDTMLYLGRLWSSVDEGAYGHGFLVLAISLYLVYQRRKRIIVLAPCPDATALPAVAVCALVWMTASLADIQLVQATILLPLLLSVTWAVAGGPITRQLLFPVLFAAFAFPFWTPLLPYLRELTASGAFFLVRLSGITAFLKDYMVQLPAGQLSIDAACSGLNYLMAALTLGVFYAYLNYRRFRHRLLVVAIAAAAAILANILRVFIIIYLADRTAMQHPYVKEHLLLGWYLFGALVLVLLGIDHVLYRRRVLPDDTAGVGIYTSGNTACRHSRLRHPLLLVTVAVLVASGPAAAWWVKSRAPVSPAVLPDLPHGQSGWAGPVVLNDSWMPVYHGASEVQRGYYTGGTRVLLYIGYYPQQSQGSELINDLNSISDHRVWLQAGAERRVTSENGQRFIETELVSAQGQQRVVWYRYRVGGFNTTSRYVAKALQVAGLLSGQQGAAVIALAADRDQDTAAARRVLDDFLAAMEPAIARTADGQASERGQERQ